MPLPVAGINRDGLYCSGFEFSPDGRWVVFRDETDDERQPAFVAMPIHAEPPFVGAPLVLGRTAAGPTVSTCWSTGPTGFVATDGGAVYRWVLG